jgi:hypothetical protein
VSKPCSPRDVIHTPVAGGMPRRGLQPHRGADVVLRLHELDESGAIHRLDTIAKVIAR